MLFLPSWDDTAKLMLLWHKDVCVFRKESHFHSGVDLRAHLSMVKPDLYMLTQGDSPKLQTQFNLLKKSNRNLCTYYGLCYYCKITTQFFWLKSSVFWLTVHLLYVLSFPANAFDRVTGWMQYLDIFLESEKNRIKYIFVCTYLYALLQRKYISLYITLLIIHRIIYCVNI